MAEPARVVAPLAGPLDAEVTVPGSKSLTNRALVCAALADGDSTINGALVAEDSAAMATALAVLGAGITPDPGDPTRLTVAGTGGRLRPGPLDLDMRQSGTTARFLAPVVALGAGAYRLDGSDQLRARPMGAVLAGVEALGARVVPGGEPGHLPVTIDAPGGLAGGEVAVPGDTSSQFLSGLLLAAPYAAAGARLRLTTALVSRPFVELTTDVMDAFGVEVARAGAGQEGGGDAFVVPPGRYRATAYAVEPDASAAAYFLAAAALVGGRVTVAGLGTGSRQGDARFADLLAAMGARVERTAAATSVTGTGRLAGLGTVDLADMPDMTPTLAVLAAFADGPTRITGVGFVRGHETDRIAAVVAELTRLGVRAEAQADGLAVHPSPAGPGPGCVATYDDHRMAMSFAVAGLRAPGISIAGPDCVAKTFPGFWDAVDRLRPVGQ
jgi:3-phosphoshikimate 1-carboxyvinyltransferase